MLVKMIKSTNPRIHKYIGETRRYFKELDCACLEKLDELGWGIRTSKILKEKYDGNMIYIKTKNSEYWLEIVEEEK